MGKFCGFWKQVRLFPVTMRCIKSVKIEVSYKSPSHAFKYSRALDMYLHTTCSWDNFTLKYTTFERNLCHMQLTLLSDKLHCKQCINDRNTSVMCLLQRLTLRCKKNISVTLGQLLFTTFIIRYCSFLFPYTFSHFSYNGLRGKSEVIASKAHAVKFKL